MVLPRHTLLVSLARLSRGGGGGGGGGGGDKERVW